MASLAGASRIPRHPALSPGSVPYAIAYEFSGEDIIVFAVAHLARRPGYWKDRK